MYVFIQRPRWVSYNILLGMYFLIGYLRQLSRFIVKAIHFCGLIKSFWRPPIISELIGRNLRGFTNKIQNVWVTFLKEYQADFNNFFMANFDCNTQQSFSIRGLQAVRASQACKYICSQEKDSRVNNNSFKTCPGAFAAWTVPY